MSGDLAAFLAARLDEDEHVARMAAEDASASANWRIEARYPGGGSAGIVGENGEQIVSDEGFPGQMEAEHIARHDPARVLREVAAGRAILARYSQPLAGLGLGEQLQLSQEKQGLYFAVCALAAVYSDHPGYRPEWKP